MIIMINIAFFLEEKALFNSDYASKMFLVVETLQPYKIAMKVCTYLETNSMYIPSAMQDF